MAKNNKKPRAKNSKASGSLTARYGRFARRRSGKFLHALIFAAVFIWIGHYLFPSHALTYPYYNGTAASADTSHINNYRVSKGYRAYGTDSCLNTIAGHWAHHEAYYNAISEPSSSWLSSQFKTYCPSHYWLALGANDGLGATEGAIFNTFLNSCPHLTNILDHSAKTTSGAYCGDTPAGFNHVGSSAYVGSSGSLFINNIFARW